MFIHTHTHIWTCIYILKQKSFSHLPLLRNYGKMCSAHIILKVMSCSWNRFLLTHMCLCVFLPLGCPPWGQSQAYKQGGSSDQLLIKGSRWERHSAAGAATELKEHITQRRYALHSYCFAPRYQGQVEVSGQESKQLGMGEELRIFWLNALNISTREKRL